MGLFPVIDAQKDSCVKQQCSDVNVKAKITDLVNKYSSLCSEESSVTNVLKYKMSLVDDEPVEKLPYAIPMSYHDKFKETLDTMLQEGIIEPSDSNYSSPCIIVPKKDTDYIRIAVDYRSLNKKVVKNRELINNTQAIFSSLSACKYFSTIDLKHSSWQIPLDKDFRKCTAFITDFGLFQYKVLPFGIKTGPAVFLRLMRKVFPDTLHVYTFLDDIFDCHTNS